MAVTHNHSSPMYSSTSWGVWAFQDVFDVRFFDYMARRIFDGGRGRRATTSSRSRVGAAVGQFDKTHRHSFGPAIADDGTPAGYPQSDTDHDLTVVRFDDVSDPDHPKPLANLVNFSRHPEFLEGNDLISRRLRRPARADDSTARPARSRSGPRARSAPPSPSARTYHSIHERLEFSHKDYAQAEYGGAADDRRARRHLARHRAATPARARTATSRSTTDSRSRWRTAGTRARSRIRTRASRTAAPTARSPGDPLLPIVGLPDCETACGRA